MADIIKLLPDSIANQIAAGEVIQRPASVVKEILENAIDAGATRLHLLIREAGKTLIQLIDNGSGMSETDARMAFERHATSKIRKAEDLQFIRTMGFRGEALASMAAVARVELKTRLQDRELGTRLQIAASVVENQQPVQAPVGTSLAISNLFYNVPARRKFLKSDAVEFRNILDEFERIALAYPEIELSLHHNDQELYALPRTQLKQRIIGVFGKNISDKLLPIEENTDLVNIGGYIGTVDACRKKRGEQYLFVNRRFIRSSYLHHAVRAAYESLIREEDHPFYVLFLDIDPARIDVNVHPSKHEIKFLDERIIYQYLRVACRHALGQYSEPVLDFEQPDRGMVHTLSTSAPPPGLKATINQAHYSESAIQQDWRKIYEGIKPEQSGQALVLGSNMSQAPAAPEEGADETFSPAPEKTPYQIHQSFIISPIASGFLLIDQEAAHQRILFDQCLKKLESQKGDSQQILFPTTLQFSGSDKALLLELMPGLKALGFDLEEFGQNAFIVHGLPVDWKETESIQAFIESLLRQTLEESDRKTNHRERLARHYARYQSIRAGQRLGAEEMQHLIDRLFACEDSAWSPFGGRCYTTFDLGEIRKKLK
ncbi:MAG TPA: DNA mismatch repair endonuclease MutL [Saprospiraceae bacterium]|nr:DNA mismatch repair endonuclease MutL [Saprospiraceae bacterium]HNT18937.1 DNA mismatch repair endonuclease MutL [Saprospiraceae bacterium]